MMLVPTCVKLSPLHGLGVFATAPIPAGTETWRLSRWDQQLTPEELAEMAPAARAAIAHHLYFHAGRWVLCFDHGRFMNHSATPNTDCRSPLVNIALRDIDAGEELTCDYAEFDQRFDPAEVGG